MKAREIMTTNVVTAEPRMRVRDVARRMVESRVSALPVVDGDRSLLGIVTESDLLHRKETGTERKRRWWVDVFADAETRANEFVKSHGLFVEDVMTRIVVTISPEMDIAEVADILDKHRIRRVPVIEDSRLVGIVSRTDLVRALAGTSEDGAAEQAENGELSKRVREALETQSWLDTAYMGFTVRDGVVQLMGFVDSTSQRNAVRVVVEEVPGVKRVDDQLRLRSWQISA